MDAPAVAQSWTDCLELTSPETTSTLLGAAGSLEASALEVISLAVRPQKVNTLSVTFAAPPPQLAGPAGDRASSQKDRKPSGQPVRPREGRPYTRIKPPGDVVKMKDRLFYALQPPIELWFNSSHLEFPFPPFPYQYEGIAFLYSRYTALLADEMGLGKTMQTISAIRMLLRTGEVPNVLLVCPKPLVTNWKREFELWAPEIPLAIIEGNQTRRHWQWRLSGVPVKLANYEVLLRDRDVVHEDGQHYGLMVIDESQRIKNTAGATAQAVNGVSRNRSWALTGTPIENDVKDLVGIFEFLAPGYLSPMMKPRALRAATVDHVLRRTKKTAEIELPPRLERGGELDLCEEQVQSYQLAEDKGVMKLKDLGQEIQIRHVFELVIRLKQICNFDPVTQKSAKLERLEADLEEVVRSGQKALVFSQWVSTLDKIGEGIKHLHPLQYHGRVPHKQRDGVIEKFRNSKKHNVLLMSYGAGAVGLNLQFASYVFLFDLWWNPAIEDQAINRAHRIGGVGPVTVTRYIATGTIEQRIDDILRAKRDLFDSIFDGKCVPSNLGLSREETFGLFNLTCKSKPIAPAA